MYKELSNELDEVKKALKYHQDPVEQLKEVSVQFQMVNSAKKLRFWLKPVESLYCADLFWSSSFFGTKLAKST